jgi:hypothetical protein
MNTYSIQRDGGGYRVRVTNPDRNWHVITGFKSVEEAREWIEEQVQIELRAPGPDRTR